MQDSAYIEYISLFDEVPVSAETDKKADEIASIETDNSEKTQSERTETKEPEKVSESTKESESGAEYSLISVLLKIMEVVFGLFKFFRID